jgi:predicted permease
MQNIPNDIRFALRALRRTPQFTLVAILSLALGLAVTASTIAVVNSYLIRSLPYPAADRLHHVIYAGPGQPEPRGIAAIDWQGLRDVVEVADNSAVTRFYLTDGAYTQEAMGLSVAPGALEALRVRVAMGRPFRDEDFAAGSEPVALIGDSLWRDRFGSATDVIGKVFRANLNDQVGETQAFRIIGVLPPDFRYVRDLARNMDVLTPLRVQRQAYMVRLRDGVPLAFAERRITDAAKNVASVIPPDWSARLESVHARYVAGLRPLLVAITIAAGLMLVIVCANLTVLMLLRMARQNREVSVRLALGAARADIFKLLAAESVLICVAALALGVALTGIMLRLLAPLIEQHLGRPAPGGTGAIGLDPTVLIAIASIGVVIALSLSFVPLLTPWQRKLSEILRRDLRTGTDGLHMRRIRSALIAFEIAGSLALLVGCGLMIRSAINLLDTDLGFNIDHVVRGRLALPMRDYPNAAALLGFYERFVDRLATRSTARVALTNWVPFYQAPMQRLEIEGNTNSGLEVAVTAVSPDYFSILDVAINRGRGFTRNDRVGTEPVAMISETLARQLWPAGDAVGRQIRTGEQPAARSRVGAWRTVVGVVKDVRQNHSDVDLKDIYIPFFQAPNQYAPLFIQSDRPPLFWLETLRTTVGEVDSSVLISGITSLADEGDRLLAPTRFLTSILTAFAVFASLVAVLGIYGVTAYAVQQREREVAIRIAVGATGSAVIRMFVKEGGLLIAAGVVFGLLGASAVTGLLTNLLYNVRPFDPATLVAACALMASAALLAIWWPARSAATKSPIQALKEN